jgi:hypothetical protein
LRPQRQVISHAGEPTAQWRPPIERADFARKYEESGLEGVLGVLLLGQHATADAQDQRAVALHEGRERRLLTVPGEALQQLLVGDGACLSGRGQFAEVPQEDAGMGRGHVRSRSGDQRIAPH